MVGDRPKASDKTGEDEEDAPAALVPEVPLADDPAPAGPSVDEEAAMLTVDRNSEEFYGQAPQAETLPAEPGEVSLPPMEDLVKRIPAPTLELLELFRAQFVTVKRVPRSALKS